MRVRSQDIFLGPELLLVVSFESGECERSVSILLISVLEQSLAGRKH